MKEEVGEAGWWFAGDVPEPPRQVQDVYPSSETLPGFCVCEKSLQEKGRAGVVF